MTPVQDCHKMTRRLLDLLEVVESNRDSQIEETAGLLDQRAAILPSIKPPFTAEEQVLGREIIQMNQEIEARLKRLNHAVKEDLKEVSMKKQSMNKYANPYESLQTDGVFYDKRN